jgi:hypothetical protein
VETPVVAFVPVPVRAEDPVLYSNANPDVEPPKAPVPSTLKPWRPDASTRGPAVDVTVASDGSVEKVRLVSGARLADMMLLSHIKAWRFEPAVRDGAPVRYQLRLEDPVVAP